jgi:IS5 family transposase
MRQERTVQAGIFDVFDEHEIGRELKAMSQWLDEHRELSGLVSLTARPSTCRAGGGEARLVTVLSRQVAEGVSPRGRHKPRREC